MVDDSSDNARVQKDLLWGMYSDIRTHARHAEVLRSNIVNYVLAIASALIAVILSDRRIERTELPMCLAVTLVGLFGLAFVASYTELYQRNRRRAERLRNLIDGGFFSGAETTIARTIEDADKSHEATLLYRCSRRVTGSSHRFWMLLPVLLIIIGLLLTVMAA